MLWGEVHNGCFIWLWRKGDKYTHITRLQRPQAKQFSYHLPSASSHLVLSSNISFQISSKGKNSIQQIIIYFVIHILLKFHTLGDRKEKQKLFRLWLYFKCHGELKWKEENLKWSDTSYVKKNFSTWYMRKLRVKEVKKLAEAHIASKQFSKNKLMSVWKKLSSFHYLNLLYIMGESDHVIIVFVVTEGNSI